MPQPLLVIAAWQLNPLAFKLSPARARDFVFLLLHEALHRPGRTSFSAFCLGISPAAAWIAIRGSLDWRMLILCAAVTLWVGGFDVLYACQDVEFDKPPASTPSQKNSASREPCSSPAPCTSSWWLAGLAGPELSSGWPAWAGIAVVAALLAYEHSLVKPNDLSKMNAAFFTVNGYISLLFLLFWGAAVVRDARFVGRRFSAAAF